MIPPLTRLIFAIGILMSITTTAFADSHIYKLYVDGLACPFCAYGVEKQVGGLDNVEAIEIQIDEGIVEVTMKPGTALNEADASQAVSDAGFTLRKFQGGKK